MSNLKTVFILTLIRLNLGEAFLTMKQEWDHYPTEAEMLAFYNGCNEADERHRNFETIMTVEKIYRVVPDKVEKTTSTLGFNAENLDEEGFVFIGDNSKPYWCRMYGDEPWFMYWHENQKSWVTLRKVNQAEIWRAKMSALTAEQAEIYHKQHREWCGEKS